MIPSLKSDVHPSKHSSLLECALWGICYALLSYMSISMPTLSDFSMPTSSDFVDFGENSVVGAAQGRGE